MYKGSIFAGRAPNSRANFLRKMLSRKIRERKLKEIWNRKQKYRKWKLRTFRLQSLFNYGLSTDYTVFKHCELLVCMVVDNSLKTS